MPEENRISASATNIYVNGSPTASFETENSRMIRGISGLTMTRANVYQGSDGTFI